ncbi:MAG TPA: CotH kinase family protein [Bacteroidales bacterium]|nr:CotH kinase family protein [Bacteroidales bacterium]
MKNLAYILIILSVLSTGCRKYYARGMDLLTPDWTAATHGDNVPPDYSTVFDESKVNRFDIVVSKDDWAGMMADLKANVGVGNPAPAISDFWDPVYVPVSLKFNGIEWYKVGLRLKGNSCLSYCVNKNIRKYSFKLNLDHFEDEYVPIHNQRFYGFKELNLFSNFGDPSEMREKTAADLFRESGVKAPRAVFCELWIDTGNGPAYFGLYTLEEEVENTVIKTQFKEGGNLYKPDGTAATFANGTYETSQFYKKTNISPADFSDVRALYDVINSEARIINYTGWKNSVNKIFDTDVFIRWLAINTVIQDWDTYGLKHHNYYIYDNPVNSKLTWIPYENSASFVAAGEKTALSLSLDEVTDGWPLIRYLIDENEYLQLYRSYLSEFITNAFSVSSFTSRIDNQASLIRDHVFSERTGYTFISSTTDFENGISFLKSHVGSRVDAVSLFLSK